MISCQSHFDVALCGLRVAAPRRLAPVDARAPRPWRRERQRRQRRPAAAARRAAEGAAARLRAVVPRAAVRRLRFAATLEEVHADYVCGVASAPCNRNIVRSRDQPILLNPRRCDGKKNGGDWGTLSVGAPRHDSAAVGTRGANKTSESSRSDEEQESFNSRVRFGNFHLVSVTILPGVDSRVRLSAATLIGLGG